MRLLKNGNTTLKKIKVPTGTIYTVDGIKKKKLEFLCVQDYGKSANIKADFMGLTNKLKGVSNSTPLLPLSEKTVVTISTQYGCSMDCKFCDVPFVGRGLNATKDDLTLQVLSAIIDNNCTHTKRFNLHYARMGEPTFNKNVLEHARLLMREVRPYINRSHVHPVLSTMLPKSHKYLMEYLNAWCDIKNEVYRGSAGLQFSINSTCDKQRAEMFSNNSLSLEEISKIGKHLPAPKGRKYALNFAIADNYEIDAQRLKALFSPDKFMCKITPIHINNSTDNNNIQTTGGYSEFYPYEQKESSLKDEGFDVIVFIPSLDEDQGMITCGNIILSGRRPKLREENK